MGIMAVGQIIVLSALFVQTFSAPSGCIESCDFYQTSYQSRRTSGGHQDHAGLVEGSAHLDDHDYVKPGNWTERNQYSTDSGRGKVHEERGQYVEGSKRVRYYKKNFTSSYGNNVNALGTAELGELSGQHRYDSLHIPSNQHFESQAHSQLGQAVTKESGYNRLHSQQTQSLSTRIDSKSEKLEDFGEYSGHSQVNQHIPRIDIPTNDRQHHVETVPENWSRVDSYKTDNGHGRVFEEEGQYVTGPKKVRYYKKNYTSSYSTSGVPQNNIDSTTVDKLHSELQRNLHKQLDNFRREFHQASSAAGHIASATHAGSTTDLTQETVGFHDLQTAESDSYRQQLDYRRIPSSGITHHHTDQQERETFIDTRQPSSHVVYPGNIAGYGTESQRTLQNHESHVSRVHPTPHSGHSPTFPGYTQVPVIRDDYQTSLHNVHASEHHIDETQRAREVLGGHRSSVAQNQLAESSRRVYNPSSSYSTYPGRRDETRHYEEHWSSSSHTGGNVAPDFTHGHTSSHAGGAHYDRDAYNEQHGRYHAAQGYDSHAHTSDNSRYNTAHRMSSGQLVTGLLGSTVDLGQAARGADCTEETQQYRQETRYHRKYKRDDHHGDVHHNEDLTQQAQELSQMVDDQQLEDLMQQNEQLTQQTESQLEFGQQTAVADQHLKDLTQKSEQFTHQTEGQLEFGQQTVGDQQQQQHQQRHIEDLTQQTESQLEFGQQTVGDQHPEDLTQQNEQLTQQTEGQLEFGQQTVGDQHLEDLTQQNKQLTQQRKGQLEFDQQTVGDQHPEDLTQQNEQLTQQREGQLEFGQQTVGNQHLEDLTQQNEQLTQQAESQFEFGQQTVGDQHLEDLTQQNEQLTQQREGQLEFGQQTVGDQHLEDLTQQNKQLTQQRKGQLEFDQQTVGDQHPEDLTQQNEQLTQQREGQLEFGQQTVGNQHLEDLTQQNEQLTQQAESQFEFGQQTVGDQHLEDLTHQNEQLTQQREGQLEFGQQTVGNQRLEDLTQQNEQLTQQAESQFEFGQQTVGDQHLEDLTQQNKQLTQQREGQLKFGQQTVGDQHPEDLTQQTQDSDDFTQQTSGKLEFGQQTVDNQHLEDLTQQTEQFQQHGITDFTQQTVGKLEYEQQNDDTRQLGHSAQQFPQQREKSEFQNDDFTQQNEQFTQQTSDDFTQQINGELELGQQTQSINKYTKPKSQRLEEFNEDNEDLTEQTTVSNDFTQQTMGQLEFEQIQPHRSSKPKVGNQHLEDFTQQNQDLTQQVGQLDDFTQQTTGNLEYGQQREQQRKPSWPGYNTQHSESFSQQSHQYPFHNDNEQSEWQLGQVSQKTEFDQDFMQQTDKQDGDQQSTTGVIKPAPKPKPRQRLRKHDSIPSRTDVTTDFDLSNPIEVSSDSDTDDFHGRNIQAGSRLIDSSSNYPRSRIIYAQGGSVFDNEKENVDRLHWVHKSNDATVGLQWHYTYHPSDLTNIEGSHDNYYPHHDSNSKPQHTDDVQRQQSTSQAQHNKYDQQLGSFQQSGQSSSYFDNQFNQDSQEAPSRVIPLQHNQNLQHTAELEKESTQTTEQTEHKMESRILEAYGGGPYDASRNDDTYRRVRPNPSATLPPIIGEDPWDIREKPRERMIPWTVVNTFSTTNTPTEKTTTQIVNERVTTEAAPPSFWNRLGHKITNTYDKAKEKAKEIFG